MFVDHKGAIDLPRKEDPREARDSPKEPSTPSSSAMQMSYQVGRFRYLVSISRIHNKISIKSIMNENM